MSRRNRLLRHLESRWIACFGEPPPILTDPDLMRAVLDEVQAERVVAAAAADREAQAIA
jgi:hypothetical protein